MIASAFMYSNSVYMVLFTCATLSQIQQQIDRFSQDARSQKLPSSLLDGGTEEAPAPWTLPRGGEKVRHWVILPQYEEDAEVVAMAMKSISHSELAKDAIGIVLAMEEREHCACEKAQKLKVRFEKDFADILITYHPRNLPNDPPGKASNLKWAFEKLEAHLASSDNLNRVMLTVADADSEFHKAYFELLTEQYLKMPPSLRNLRIFQAPVFHFKNYHRQPGPVVVGTLFTAMSELSVAADPNSVRFPYSTYSLSFELVKRVGGWDAEWIAEDWHMGIKCFLMTVGICKVESVNLPILNYTPEDSTYISTINARWSQAKRHALGFSDISYYFMMLPLIFGYAVSKADMPGGSRRSPSNVHLRAFWGLVFNGIAMIIRLVNVHVVIGIMVLYYFLNLVLRFVMCQLIIPGDRIWLLFDRTMFLGNSVVGASFFFSTAVTLLSMWVYRLVGHRVEDKKDAPFYYRFTFLHILYCLGCFTVFGGVYFFAIAAAVWRAAYKMLTNPVFEYEVAPKPKPEKCADTEDGAATSS
jgi:hypothetical protein